jgi:hypothetical protein
MASENPTVGRLDGQIKWYDQKSMNNQRWFKGLKVTQIVAAALIPFLASLQAMGIADHMTLAAGGLGILIVILEGLQSLNQYQHNWITYRSACEELKHEKYLWFAKAGPYLDAENCDALFAERVESLVSREHAKWVSARQKAERDLKRKES